MKNLLTFAATFALGVSALQLVPGHYQLPPKSAVPAPATLGRSNVTLGWDGNSSCPTHKVRAEYVFVSVSDAPLRLPKTYSEAQRADFDRQTIKR